MEDQFLCSQEGLQNSIQANLQYLNMVPDQKNIMPFFVDGLMNMRNDWEEFKKEIREVRELDKAPFKEDQISHEFEKGKYDLISESSKSYGETPKQRKM